MKGLALILGIILIIIGLSAAPVTLGMSALIFLMPGAKMVDYALRDK